MPGNIVQINNSPELEFYVGDSKMPLLLNILEEVGIREVRADEEPVARLYSDEVVRAEVRKAVGLLPVREHLHKRARGVVDMAKSGHLDGLSPRDLDEYLRIRQTGRTTEILLSALVVAASGRRVCIASEKPVVRKEMRRILLDWFEKLEIQKKLLVKNEEHGVVVFRDHSY